MYYVASNGIKTVVVSPDPDPQNPRDPGYQDNITKMACWHSRRSLGDEHDFFRPYDFAADMVLKHVKQKDVFAAMEKGELPDFRLVPDENHDGRYAVDALVGLIPGKEKWERMDWAVAKDTFEVIEGEATFDLEEDVLANCYPDTLVRLCEKYGDVAILPLYLYDHSGISMSTGSFVGRAPHADWDSGQVGYIYMDKATAMENLALPSEKIRLASAVPYAESISIRRGPADKVEDIMAANGYTPVRLEDIRNADAPKDSKNPSQPIILPEWAEQGLLYKKCSKLFVFESFRQDDTFSIQPVAYFNPELKPLTEETWKARAKEVLEADVKEYDNYLTGEVYGYQCFEGTNEVESCWGFNPGSEDIKTLMKEELEGWFGSKIEFESDYSDSFNIEDYFFNNEFPELQAKILEDVKSFITFEGETSAVYPFDMSADDLLNNKNGVLDDIVQTLYDAHESYDSDKIFDAITEHAGVCRELQPKLSVTDLDPERDYTAEEIMEVFKKKPSLNDLIATAAGRTQSQQPFQPDKGFEQDRF